MVGSCSPIKKIFTTFYEKNSSSDPLQLIVARLEAMQGLINEQKNPIDSLLLHCIHRMLSGGYYGFDFVTPMPPPQCVESFHCYRSNEKNIIASLLKFAGYIHSHKILRGNIFGLILKNKMTATGVFRL